MVGLTCLWLVICIGIARILRRVAASEGEDAIEKNDGAFHRLIAETAGNLGLSPVFMGVVVLALVGTIADLFAAVAFARADKMDIVIGLCIGSAIQIALVVAPILVLASWALGHPMNLVFGSPLDLFAIASAAFIVLAIVEDGETTWYEGFLLIGVYALFALAYFFEGPG